MRKTSYLLALTLAAAIAVRGGAGCQQAKPAPLPDVDQPVELLTAPTLAGPALDLAALRGKVVVVHFWSPSCGVCAREAPELQAVADELSPRGLELVTVMMEGSDAAGNRWVAQHGVRAPVVQGSMELAAAYNMQVYPWTVIVGRDGKAREVLRGGRSAEQLRKAFSAYL